MRHTFKTTLLLASCFAASFGQMASAKSWVDEAATQSRVNTKVVKDDTVLLRTDAAFKEVRVANADIADIVVLTDKSFQLLGKQTGKTNVMLYDAEKRLVDILDVTVGYDLVGLKKSLYENLPGERINVRTMAGGIYLSGDVTNEPISKQAEKIAQAYAPNKVTNGLTIRDSHQVMLEVRFIEASRNAIKELGINVLTQRAGDFLQSSASIANPVLSGALSTNFGSTSFDASLQALEEKGIIRTLAEPNLVSMSGETASFLAGGEFPIPVSVDGDQIGIEFREFGVSLAFTPTVLDDGIINLKVAPEVSQLDNTNALVLEGVEIPALRVRRASTTIELRNSQSFAIAGLLQNDTSNSKAQTPWIGDVPVLGALFRSSRYQKSETELVIIVTPRLVQPAPDVSDLATPLDELTVPSDLESFLGGSIEGPLAQKADLATHRSVK